jgi:hypothetical protein
VWWHGLASYGAIHSLLVICAALQSFSRRGQMIRVSIEVPEREEYRFDPLWGQRDRFFDEGIFLCFRDPGPDLRIVELDAAIAELGRSTNGRFNTPIIIDEENDGAEVGDSVATRSMLAHPDVKFWLKQNSFRDVALNNRGFATTQFHTDILNGIPEFHVELPAHECSMPVSNEMASKIRVIPLAGVNDFKSLYQQEIDWSKARRIDVIFAGWVDYPASYLFHEVTRVLATRHRRAAIEQLARLRGLRVLLGINKMMELESYRAAMRDSWIAISPWGHGEFAFRDYEAILAGCVMVKPITDHVTTFAPDIYQSGKYYLPCKPDFSDLPQVIESIMTNKAHAINLARQAREDMLTANSPERIYDFYFDVFCQALGRSRS